MAARPGYVLAKTITELSPTTLAALQAAAANDARRNGLAPAIQKPCSARRMRSTPPTAEAAPPDEARFAPKYERPPGVQDTLRRLADELGATWDETSVEHYRVRFQQATWAGQTMYAPDTVRDAVPTAWLGSRPWHDVVWPLLATSDRGRVRVYGGSSNDVYTLDASAARTAGIPVEICALNLTYRVTKPDARGMTWDEVCEELASALSMAAIGVGPPVYAVCAWPLRRPGKGVRWAMLMAMRHCAAPLHNHSATFDDAGEVAAARAGEAAAARAIDLCARIAMRGYVHYDLKCGNVLADLVGGRTTLWAIDFAPLFFMAPEDEVLDVKARMLLNLLLLTVHAAIYCWDAANPGFVRGFVAVMRAPLLELWTEAVASAAPARLPPATASGAQRPGAAFGAGGALLDGVNLLTPSPRLRLSSIDFRRLPTPGAVYTKMLQSIVYEYFFDRRNGNGNGTTDDAPPDPPTMVKNWAGVDGAGWKYEKNTGFGVKRAPLVRQLLRFALFRFETTEELPDRWRDVLRCDLD